MEIEQNRKRCQENIDYWSFDEESEIVPELSESDISDLNSFDGDEEFYVIHDNFEPLSRKPIAGDYVLVLFVTKIEIYYIVQVLDFITANTYEVSFLRMKNKENMTFFLPLESDLAEINIKDTKMILPEPKINGRKNRSSIYDYPVHVVPILNIW